MDIDEQTAALILRVLRAVDDPFDALWWQTGGKYAPVTFFINCNDIFYWGTADAEEITVDNIDVLEQAIADCAALGHEEEGVYLFCARVRQLRPQGAAYPKYPELWPLFDACGPEREVNFSNPRPHPANKEVTGGH